MSWLSALAKIGGLAAAPFSGGASLALTGLGAVGDVLGKQQGAAAQGNATEANILNNRDRNAVDLYQTQQGAQNQAGALDLQRKAFTTSDRGNVMKQALLGAILQGGGGPSQVSVPGAHVTANVSNPMAGLLNDPQFLASLSHFRDQTSTAGSAPPTFSGGNIVAPPSLSKLPEAGKGSSFLNVLARIAQLGGAVAPMIPGKSGSGGPLNPGDWGGYG